MVSSPLKTKTNTWTTATWEEFLSLADSAEHREDLKNASLYYDAGRMRIENMPTGFAHGQDHFLLSSVVSLYGTFHNLKFLPVDNSSFRKADEQECQPDLAVYIGSPLPDIPRSNQPVDVNRYGPPSLAIEIAASSLSDDLGQKRLLYERMGIQEYWVVDVEAFNITAFAIADGGSRAIQTSAVLPNLQVSLVEEALRRNQSEDIGTVNRWLIEQFTL